MIPYSGSLTPPTTFRTFTFTTLDTLADSVTIEIQFTKPDGTICFRKLPRKRLPNCPHWISEKQDSAANPAGEMRMANAMMVYPNPAGQKVNISYDYGSANYLERSISIYDQLGRKIDYAEIPDAHGIWNINTANWTPGMYIIRMEADGTPLQVQRLIVSN